MSEYSLKDKNAKLAAKFRKEKIDADIARYGESYARITLSESGELKMEHIQRNLVRPIIAITHPIDKK